MITLDHYLMLSIILFCIGAFGVLVRRNILIILMSVELMLSAGNIALVAFSRFQGNLDGQVYVLFSFVVAAAEVAVGLGIVIAAFRHRPTIELGEWKALKG